MHCLWTKRDILQTYREHLKNPLTYIILQPVWKNFSERRRYIKLSPIQPSIHCWDTSPERVFFLVSDGRNICYFCHLSAKQQSQHRNKRIFFFAFAHKFFRLHLLFYFDLRIHFFGVSKKKNSFFSHHFLLFFVARLQSFITPRKLEGLFTSFIHSLISLSPSSFHIPQRGGLKEILFSFPFWSSCLDFFARIREKWYCGTQNEIDTKCLPLHGDDDDDDASLKSYHLHKVGLPVWLNLP